MRHHNDVPTDPQGAKKMVILRHWYHRRRKRTLLCKETGNGESLEKLWQNDACKINVTMSNAIVNAYIKKSNVTNKSYYQFYANVRQRY